MSKIKNYSNALYIVSNENLRAAVAATPNAKRVLTITGSGDQALFYTLGGATHVDTFDKLSNARTIQDIKTAAISQLSYSQYLDMMYNLRDNPKKYVPKIVQAKMPASSVAELDGLTFRNGVDRRDSSPLPTAQEYARLQATIRGHFNFFHENLTDIHSCVTGPYDVINISNIFDMNYIYDRQQQTQILTNLAPLLRVGGAIVYYSQTGRTYIDGKMPLPIPDIDICHKSVPLPERMCIDLFQRTR